MKYFAALLLSAVLFVACGDESSSSAPAPDPSEESSSSVEKTKESSSSVKPTSGEDKQSSSSAKKEDSSSSAVKASSSSVTPKSSSSGEVKQSSSSVVASSSSVTSSETVKSSSSLSSSSEYVPFDHSKAFDGPLWRAGAYKTFVDARNGREYYYLEMDANGKSLKVMAENLNIGEMVWGFKDQKDDSKIERYCYDDDTTKCDRYGALYQWAEMMQLPSECNTKSCADQIKPNHQGICPDGWRLLTYDDFKFIINSNGNTHGVEGTRSTFGFGGYNTTGFSLVGAGSNWDYNFTSLNSATYWHYPEESSQYTNEGSFYSSQGTNSTKNPRLETMKIHGFSVRCVMVE
ncbi:FISUMP domain-containing protein [Fibrobacter sp. UWB10]|uniref:FISUMP domain-containing protein n=1 Tax=Fibrobacter sp. UWB10 TaxID=1896201 RepID=UPI002402FFF9|nr:FISUMP domain-containing protein [Fibrobacter sp. UWB10]SMP48099.1 major paralogous domain-containing protein [Fibrobacter sp. UWB10]